MLPDGAVASRGMLPATASGTMPPPLPWEGLWAPR
jgi:hypothetical protein